MQRNKIYLGIAIAVILVFGVVIAMGGGSNSKNPTVDKAKGNRNEMSKAKTAENNTVAISNFKFAQQKITVKKGATVTWNNEDPAEHNVVFDDSSAGEVEAGKLISKGESVSFTFDKVGIFPYHCIPHPYMTGTVEVVE